jgi:RimJ/RimL family protein N-acetyltransferase
LPPIDLPDPPLSDGAVALRAYTGADISALVAICQDPEIPRWTLVPSPYTENDARAWMERVEQGHATGTRITFAIVEVPAPDALLGSVGLQKVEWEQRAADVGYMLGAHARGRGVATRALELVAGWAFGTLGLERLELRTLADNRASRAVARRAGFSPIDAPVVRRPECDDMPDVYFARLRDR